MGFMGARILADRENPGRYVMVADSGSSTPNCRPRKRLSGRLGRAQTAGVRGTLRATTTGEPEWRHFDELYRTPFV